MSEQAFFESNGSKVAANLYYPKKDGKVPGIVMCHGFAGVKELLLPSFAQRFSEGGFAVLTFDYRGFGQSEGERGRLVPSLQIEDIVNGLAFLRSCEKVDSERIGLWGTSFGGANAIFAALQDSNVKSVAVQLTFANGERVVTHDMSETEKANLYALIEKMKDRKVRSGKEMFVPIHKVLTDPQSKAFYENNVEQHPELNIKISMLTVAETIMHKPELVISDLKIPILITAASKDGVNPVEESMILYKSANDPKDLFIIQGATHYEVYSGDFFERAIAKQLSWFTKTLATDYSFAET